MHILFCKGVYSHLIGGILHYACWLEGPGKVCKEKPWKRLGLIFKEIQEEYKSHRSSLYHWNLQIHRGIHTHLCYNRSTEIYKV